MKSISILSIICLFFISLLPLSAQESIEDEYEAFVKQRVNEMVEFRNQRDKEFASFLKEYWEMYIATAGIKQPMPGPDNPIYYKPAEKPKEPIIEKESKPVTPKAKPTLKPPSVKPESKSKPTPKPDGSIDKTTQAHITFYGGQYAVSKPNTTVYLSNIEETHLAEAWTTLSKANYGAIVNDCLRLKKELNLNDWGYIMLAKSAGQLLSKRQTADEIVFGQMFILLQSNYKVRMARVNNRLAMLVATDQLLYDTPFTEVGHDRYFVITNNRNEDINAVYSYNKDFAAATIYISMDIEYMPQLVDNNYQEVMETENSLQKISSSVNENLINYFKDYPQCDISIYMNAKPSIQFQNFIEPQFAAMIEGKSTVDAASILLRYIQLGFKYATDQQQFGYEKPFFIDENFFYPQNDCEDRAILYGYLMKSLLQLDVIV
ncbi:hypothetical protein [Dysgonomonas sp. ZJ709]|uniref:hypothetical protein n=1 Tax=Dysgonomonas sp. ZJ709 TaxID=2709797 RepID=UPI0013EAF334|nr:hypothetical protein [Dysgonomonas sp. ZJ709]